MNNQDDDFFFDPEHDEAEGPAELPTFSTVSALSPGRKKLNAQKEFLERLLVAWQAKHGKEIKKAA